MAVFFKIFFLFCVLALVNSQLEFAGNVLGVVDTLTSISGFAKQLSDISRKTLVIGIDIFNFFENTGYDFEFELIITSTTDSRRTHIVAPALIGRNAIFEIGFDDNGTTHRITLIYTGVGFDENLIIEFSWFGEEATIDGILFEPRITMKVNDVFLVIVQDYQDQPQYYTTDLTTEAFNIGSLIMNSRCVGGFDLSRDNPDVGMVTCSWRPGRSAEYTKMTIEGNSECFSVRKDNSKIINSDVFSDHFLENFSGSGVATVESITKIYCGSELVFKIKKNKNTLTFKNSEGDQLESFELSPENELVVNSFFHNNHGMKCSSRFVRSTLLEKIEITCFIN